MQYALRFFKKIFLVGNFRELASSKCHHQFLLLISKQEIKSTLSFGNYPAPILFDCIFALKLVPLGFLLSTKDIGED